MHLWNSFPLLAWSDHYSSQVEQPTPHHKLVEKSLTPRTLGGGTMIASVSQTADIRKISHASVFLFTILSFKPCYSKNNCSLHYFLFSTSKSKDLKQIIDLKVFSLVTCRINNWTAHSSINQWTFLHRHDKRINL